MLRQLRSSLACDGFFPYQCEEKRGPRFGLFGACFSNYLWIDIGKSSWRVRTIAFGISGRGKKNLAILRQKIDWLLIPK